MEAMQVRLVWQFSIWTKCNGVGLIASDKYPYFEPQVTNVHTTWLNNTIVRFSFRFCLTSPIAASISEKNKTNSILRNLHSISIPIISEDYPVPQFEPSNCRNNSFE